jgi:multidrug efflux system membrane fusion protein
VQANAIAVPTRAVLAGQQGSYVFVIGGDKTAKVRPISVGREVGEMTTIEQGLTAGEQVVVDGQSRLTPNAKVDVKAIAPPANGATPAATQAGGTR